MTLTNLGYNGRTIFKPAKIEAHPEEVSQYFDEWARANGFPHFRSFDYDAMLHCSSILQSGSANVLDVGCGAGYVSNFLKGQGHHVVGLDLSRESIQLAISRGHVDEGIVASAYEMGSLGRQFDVVLLFGILYGLLDLKKVLAEATQLVRPGGHLLVADHHRRNPYVMLHFARPDWVDRWLEGKSNLPRRAIDETMIQQNSPPQMRWGTPAYFCAYTVHPNSTINAAHLVARMVFGGVRKVHQAPWTGNFMVMVGTKV